MILYQVIIIDDEPIIRKGIRNIIDWKKLNCTVCAEAGDGRTGLARIAELRPEIIVTDIKMPGMDGLAMIREMRRSLPHSKVIILTGYRDFDYAREAVKIGAFDFLLKPSKIEELDAVLRRAVGELDRQAERAVEMERIRAQYEKSKPILKERLLYNMIYGLYSDEADVGAEAENLGLHVGRFFMGLLRTEVGPGGGEEEKDRARLYQLGVMNILEEVFSDPFVLYCLPLGRDTIVLIVSRSGSLPCSLEEIHGKCEYLQKMIYSCFNFTVTIALSEQGNGCADLPGKFGEASKAMEYRFYMGANSIIHYGDLGNLFQYSDFTPLYDLQKKLLMNIRAGNTADTRSVTEEIYKWLGSIGYSDQSFICNFYFNTIMQIHSIRRALPGRPAEEGEAPHYVSLYCMIAKCDNLADLSDLLGQISAKAVEEVRRYNDNSTKLMLRKALDYIAAHYQEEITLGVVAEHIYVSSFYISHIFRKELNINFVDYLNQLRISKAKELLLDGRLKLYEIAEAVGIRNPHYFSRLFRKYAGMTASEYRQSVGGPKRQVAEQA